MCIRDSQWVVVLRETKLSSVMTRQVAEAICLEHDTRADGTLDYAALCDDIFPGDFDHYAHQQHFVYKVRALASCFTLSPVSVMFSYVCCLRPPPPSSLSSSLCK